MSALMDRLLYAGDDSGDEDELNARPMSPFSARIPSTSAFSLAAPFPGALESLAGVVASASSAMSPPSVSVPVSTMALASATTAPPRPTAAGAGSTRRPVLDGGLFPQTFAMLKQVLPPEQYVVLHSEMPNGNSNDGKSFADNIERATGNTIVASVAQRINLARYQLTGAQSGTPAPLSSAAAGARSTPLARALTTNPLYSAFSQLPTVVPSSREVPVAAFKTSVTIKGPRLMAAKPPSTTGKSESSPSFPPSPLVTSTATAAPAATGSVSSAISEQDKIRSARYLVLHVSSCTLPPGNCRYKRCGDLRHKIRHSVSCYAQNCLTCIQLRAFVDYHAKACLVLVGEHCMIPFCDDIRCQQATAVPATTAASALATTTTLSSAMSGNYEDNISLVSPAAGLTDNITTKSPTLLRMLSPRTLLAAASKETPTGKPTETSARAPNTSTLSSTSSPTPASAAAAARLHAQEHGRLLQIILHVQKCTTSTCAVGKVCVETRKLLRQANAPGAPVRAQTLEKVYRHHKICLTKSNTQNCPICKIGLMPIVAMNGYSTERATSSPQFAATVSSLLNFRQDSRLVDARCFPCAA